MLKIYNSLSRREEVFQPRKDKKVQIFVCGPTVYDFSHLGHARTYIFYDNFVNYLKYQGYKVVYIQNITDIDDKIIQRAKTEKKDWRDIARKYEKGYLKDMKALKIENVSKYARATENIKEIKSQVKRLLEKGVAYQTKDGIYYDIKKFSDYGKLSRRTVEQAEDAVSRVDMAEGKRNKGDFCLWKYTNNLNSFTAHSIRKGRYEYEPAWQSPWGWGRPGWHIEDTAIAEKYFGFQYDIHGGARELIFPHHEAEIAQMEALSGKKPMVRYWVHSGLLTVDGQKMAKSLGNFKTIGDFLKKHSPWVLRFITFSSRYNSPLDYSEKTAEEAEENLKKIKEFLIRLRGVRNKIKKENRGFIVSFEKKVFEGLENDFNTPWVKALIFSFISETNRKIDQNNISRKESQEIIKVFRNINKIFKLLDFREIKKEEKLPKGVKKLVQLREKYRKQKKWQKADEIREEIGKLGYKIDDTEAKPKVSECK